jgi:recombination protein RecA
MVKKYAEFIDEIREEYGADVTDMVEKLPPIPTGSLSLDASLGTGGIPRGKVTVLYGAESTGKTTLSLNICKYACREGKVLYVDAENMLDKEYAKTIIGEEFWSNFIVVQPNTAEDVLSIMGKGVRSGVFTTVILDSIGALAPEKEKEEEDFNKQDVGLVPKLVSKFLRIYFYWIRTNNVACIIVNQVRDNIGAYMSSYTLPGGHALKHAASIIILLSSGEKMEQNGVKTGISVTFTTKKNKLAPPFRSDTFPIRFGYGIDELRDLVLFASTIGVIKKSGSFYKYDEVTMGHGVNDTMLYLGEHPDVQTDIRNKAIAIVASYNKSEVAVEEEDGEPLTD